MIRPYVTGVKLIERERNTEVTMFFDHRVEKGYAPETKERAQYACLVFASYNVRVPLANGHEGTCKNFRVEEQATGKFAISCDYPTCA